jgi:hypothetical protein
MKVTDIFNTQDIPRLDRNAPAFTRDTMNTIRASYLVMIFNRAADVNALANDVVAAQEKSYISDFILVSRDDGANPPVYKKIDVRTPYWSGDALADAVAKGNARTRWRNEFLGHITRAWERMHRAASTTVTFSKSFVITSDMTDKDKDRVAYDDLHKILQAQLADGNKKLAAAERQYAFDGTLNESLVRRALASQMQRPDLLEAFIYMPAEMNIKYMQEQLIKAANLFQIPAGSDFNGRPLIAFPGDDAAAADLKTKAAQLKLSL